MQEKNNKNTYGSLEKKYLKHISKDLAMQIKHIPSKRGIFKHLRSHLTEVWADIKFFLRVTEDSPTDVELCTLLCKVAHSIAYEMQKQIYTALKKMPCNISAFLTYCDARNLVINEDFDFPSDFLQSHNPVADSKMPRLLELAACQGIVDNFKTKVNILMDLCYGLNAKNLLIPISTEEQEIPKVSEPSFILDCLYSELEQTSFPIDLIKLDQDDNYVTDITRVTRITQDGCYVCYMCPCPSFRESIDPSSKKKNSYLHPDEIVMPIVGVKIEKISKKKDLHFNTADSLALYEILDNFENIPEI